MIVVLGAPRGGCYIDTTFKLLPAVYEDLRVHGVRALENYYEAADFGEVDSRLEALEAILWALRSDIVRSRRDQRAMELRYCFRATSGKPRMFTQMDLF